MLAQNFKTAADLKITDRQKDALIKTLVLLETGKLVQWPTKNFPYKKSLSDDFFGYFNMNEWSCKYQCGTVACIGGTAERVGNLVNHELRRASAYNNPLHQLFYPPTLTYFDIITLDQAAVALRSYLTTGHACWEDASK